MGRGHIFGDAQWNSTCSAHQLCFKTIAIKPARVLTNYVRVTRMPAQRLWSPFARLTFRVCIISFIEATFWESWKVVALESQNISHAETWSFLSSVSEYPFPFSYSGSFTEFHGCEPKMGLTTEPALELCNRLITSTTQVLVFAWPRATAGIVTFVL